MLDDSEELDEIDREILNLLIDNSRISNAEIARKINLSRVAVRDRIQSLIQRGIIQQFTTILDAEALGYPLAAFFEIEVQPEMLDQVAEELTKQVDVTIVYHMTGPTSLHVHACLRDSQHLSEFLKENIYSIPGVLKVSSYLLLNRYKSVLSVR
ncbi:Lrp/AsnC family transcriptional regulator [Desulfitobacterium sp.]|uniref:Lrp/AsnC family transcriptional regulator n=1 Tax=Desulfitobacterium sp. TaxID=49981 RepID=UPI002B698656|nr:Lrp/AsnC family transcriptional regulator [Desulfitobacterium sp.]HVJ50807.1 Lrp/AsnC family transcriptional regulator [Desulfitobacterium sp.]